MKIKSFSRRKLRHPTLRLTFVPVTETNLRVSALGLHDWARCSYEYIFLSPSAEVTGDTSEEIEPAEAYGGMCCSIVAFALSNHVQIAEIAHRNSLLWDTKEATEKLGPLKVVLGAIPAAYENNEVR